MAKATSTAGSRKSTRICGTSKLEYCPTDNTPIDLATIAAQLITNGAAYEDGTALSGTVGTDFSIDAISVVAYDTGVRANDVLTGGIVEGTECGVVITNNGSSVVGEANESNVTESVYDDFAVAAIAGTACFQLDITFAAN